MPLATGNLMSLQLVLSIVIPTLHVLLVIAIALRVIMRQPARGIALAWLLLVAMVPFVGGIIYLLIGERRIGRRRTQGNGYVAHGLPEDFRRRDPVRSHGGRSGRVTRPRPRAWTGSAVNLVGSATVCGSRSQLFSDTHEILQAIVRDVDRAKTSVLMEFYIYCEGGLADDVLEALIRAAQRGVHCRVLIDALGARPWWKGKQPKRLRRRRRRSCGRLCRLACSVPWSAAPTCVCIGRSYSWTGKWPGPAA